MRVNEENFTAGNKEDIEPSYVESVLGNHNNDENAHPGIQAFYQNARNVVMAAANSAQAAAKTASNDAAVVEQALSEMGNISEGVYRAVRRYPYIGADGHWYVWNNQSLEFERSDFFAIGQTPERGVDYWTEDDKAEIVADVMAALPIAEEVKF